MAFGSKNANPAEENEKGIKQCEQLEQMLREISTELVSVGKLAEKLPEINRRFDEICARVESLEKKYVNMQQEQSEREKELIEMLREHIKVGTDKLGQLTDKSVKELNAASERSKKETETIVVDMQKSLDSISESLSESLRPFKDSLITLKTLDDAAAKAMDRLLTAVEAIAKVSQPHADLAKETAVLINESISNIKNIASASTQIITIELRDAVDKAVRELSAASK